LPKLLIQWKIGIISSYNHCSGIKPLSKFRLNNLTYMSDIISNECFKYSFAIKSSPENLFILHILIHIMKKKKKKLSCAFIDFAKAFDTVWRNGLWNKLLINQINGKMFPSRLNIKKTKREINFPLV
jgi:hypothetical protein